MKFLRQFIGLTAVLLFSVLSAVAIPMMPKASHHAEFVPHQETAATKHAKVHFAVRAPPISVAKVAFTSSAVAEHGNDIVVHRPETQLASFGIGDGGGTQASTNSEITVNPGDISPLNGGIE